MKSKKTNSKNKNFKTKNKKNKVSTHLISLVLSVAIGFTVSALYCYFSADLYYYDKAEKNLSLEQVTDFNTENYSNGYIDNGEIKTGSFSDETKKAFVSDMSKYKFSALPKVKAFPIIYLSISNKSYICEMEMFNDTGEFSPDCSVYSVGNKLYIITFQDVETLESAVTLYVADAPATDLIKNTAADDLGKATYTYYQYLNSKDEYAEFYTTQKAGFIWVAVSLISLAVIENLIKRKKVFN